MANLIFPKYKPTRNSSCFISGENLTSMTKKIVQSSNTGITFRAGATTSIKAKGSRRMTRAL